MIHTIRDVLSWHPERSSAPLSAPSFNPSGKTGRLMLAVESMSRHMTDEGWQIALALQHAGYKLSGNMIDNVNPQGTDVPWALNAYDPGTLVVQDKREWEGLTADRSRDRLLRFNNIETLRKREDIFKLTILKDAHNNPNWHREAAEEMGCHAWIVYYHPDIVCHLAPYVRRAHVIRTYHSLDAELVPEFTADRSGAVVTGAISSAYPLRRKVFQCASQLRAQTVKHPGYHRHGSCTPQFLTLLSQFKVSICTSSRFGYALRKVMESVACGCRVITDLAIDEKLPEIDANLIRVSPNISMDELRVVIASAVNGYNSEQQEHYAARAKAYYDYRSLGQQLASKIDELKEHYVPVLATE